MQYFWLLLVVFVQLLNAVIVLIDKYVVTKRLPHSVVYAFFVGALSSIVLVLIPTGNITVPTTKIIIFSLLCGFTYIQAIVYLYKALRRSPDPLDVIPVVGAMTAISTFILSSIFLKELLPSLFILATIFLVLGTLLTSHFSFKPKIMFYILASGIFLGISSVLVKMVLSDTTFVNGFFWTRIGNVFGAIMLFIWPENLRLIREGFKSSSRGTKLMIVSNKVLAGITAVLFLYVIKLSSASLVNALVGLQYVFLLLLGLLFGKKFSEFVYNPKHSYEIFHKIISVSFIVAGFFLLFI
ncbi:MAG: hypothetical protein PHV93_02970 [Candidatus Pacebacteria bacterium]|nr:hypothetical protein [Candidatus Paceibacterota bacterium]